MSRVMVWGEAIWPGRWHRWLSDQDFNLLPWRQARQWQEWLALGSGVLVGAALGLGVALGLVALDQDALTQLQNESQALRTRLQHGRDRLADWQLRWTWQLRHEAHQAWRGEALRGLFQALSASPGEVRLQALSWDGHQAQVELWVVHPERAQPWLHRHWQPFAASTWQRQGEWQPIRYAAGEWGDAGATIWMGRWRHLAPAAHPRLPEQQP